MYRLLLSALTIIVFFIMSATSSVSEPLAMFFLGASLVGISSSTTKIKKK